MSKRYGIRLEAQNGDKVKATLTDIGKAGSTAFGTMSTQADKAVKSMKGFKTLGSVFGGLKSAIFNVKSALLGLVGVGGFGAAVKMSVSYASNLKDLSVTANTSAESLQEINYAAMQLGITQEQVVDGLKEMILRADEFVETGGGPAAEAFERLGYTQEELAVKMKDTDRLFIDIINRMQDMDKAANIRISDELFGGSAGETFVRFVEIGTDAIIELREEAREMGIVLSDEVVAQADKASDRLNALSEILRTKLIVAIADNSEEIGQFADRMITELPNAIAKVERLAEVIGLLERKPSLDSLKEMRHELELLNQEAVKQPSLLKQLGVAIATPDRKTIGVSKVISDKNFKEQIATVKEFNEEAQALIKEAIAKNEQAHKIQVDSAVISAEASMGEIDGILNGLYKDDDKGTRKSKGRASNTKSSNKIEQNNKLLDQNKQLIQDYERQILLLQATEKEIFIEQQTRRLNNEATAEQEEHMRELASLYYDNVEAAEQYSSSVQSLGHSLDGFLNSVLSGSLQSAEDWRDGILNLVQDVASEITRMQFGGTSGGGLGTVLASSILNSFGFGGGYASSSNLDIQWNASRRAAGGPVYAGKVYSVNESEPEHFIPFVNGSVVPQSKMNNASAGVTVNVHNNSGSNVSVEQSQTANGQNIDIIIDRKVAALVRDKSSFTHHALTDQSAPQSFRR